MVIKIPRKLKEGSKVIGYFSYTDAGHVFCDGDACMVAGSSESMKSYFEKDASNTNEKDFIKKMRFGELIEGLSQGGAYAFDEEAYTRFYHHARNNNMEGLPPKEIFSESPLAMHFLRIQMAG